MDSRGSPIRLFVMALLFVLAAIAVRFHHSAIATSGAGELKWFKGNTHTHTLNSDGDSAPGEVAHWYRDHEYDFLVLSDHNYYTQIDLLQREFDREVYVRGKRPFLLIPGEEVTDRFDEVQVHINAVDSNRVVGPRRGGSVRETLQRNVDAIHAAGGIPHVNHPNFRWSLSADDLAGIKGLKHFEIFNGHPGVHNFGGGGYPSLEEMWDDLLSRGQRIFGVAVDDAHNFQTWGPRESNPGKGWIMVRAAELTRSAIRTAFEAGNYYCSTGVTLADLAHEDSTLRVEVEKEGDTKFTTFYIGQGGRVLARVKELSSSYTLRAGDKYVRARVVSSRGEYAWTQPLFAP